MIIIRTAEEMARALDSPISPQLRAILKEHVARLAEWLDDYSLEQLVAFAVAAPGDTAEAINAALGLPLVGAEAENSTALAECVDRLGGWTVATFVLSDDGWGVVLIVHPEADPCLLSALSDQPVKH